MTYALSRSKNGYFVVTEGTGKKHSKHPLTKETATKQMRALYYFAKK